MIKLAQVLLVIPWLELLPKQERKISTYQTLLKNIIDISFVGLGKLGLSLACTLAGSGNRVWGIDKNPYFIENLSNDNLPFYEPGLDEIFPNKNFVDFSDSYESIISNTDATIILVSTQSDDGYSSANVEAALEELSISLKESKKDYHLIVLSSTISKEIW